MQMNNKKKMVGQSDLGDGRYRNPILYADYSDPDVIRVGDTYYMTASSFNFMPGLPILTSKDLVNWELVNHAVKRLPYDIYDKPAHAKGIWAPSIRYHDNKFWICVGMPDEGIFMTTATDPLGEWTPLRCIWEGKGFIDPCPFWDDDGKAYIIHAYANSRIGFKSRLGILEMDAEGTKCLSEDKFIFDGTVTQPTIEGPKVYKRDGMYYILAPAGGVTYGWQTALRSSNIYGPYEEKKVMHQGSANTNGPHQGGLVDTPGGEEWFIHFQDKGVYGRIAHLQPVQWKDGWPIIGIDKENKGIGEPVEVYKKPDGLINSQLSEPDTSDDFDKDKLGLQWQWMANYSQDFYSLTEREGSLCLYPINTTGDDKALIWNSANILTQKIPCPAFTAKTHIDFSQLPIGGKTGLILIGGQYASLCIENTATGIRLYYLESSGDGEVRDEHIIEEYTCPKNNNLICKMNFYEDGTAEFSYLIEDDKWSIPTRRFSPKGAVWVGAKIGIYAISNCDIRPKGKVFFDYVEVEAMNGEV